MNDYANSGAVWIIFLVIYIIWSIPLYVMGTKTSAKNPWFAFVPILNAFLFVEIAGKDWWWVLLMCVPCINVIVGIYLWMCVAESMNKPSWVGLLMIVPVVGLAVPYYLAFA